MRIFKPGPYERLQTQEKRRGKTREALDRSLGKRATSLACSSPPTGNVQLLDHSTPELGVGASVAEITGGIVEYLDQIGAKPLRKPQPVEPPIEEELVSLYPASSEIQPVSPASTSPEPRGRVVNRDQERGGPAYRTAEAIGTVQANMQASLAEDLARITEAIPRLRS